MAALSPYGATLARPTPWQAGLRRVGEALDLNALQGLAAVRTADNERS